MRLFPSKENWRRYKWVTKIGIVGAYASIISGTYIVSQLILSPLINKELVTNKDLQTDIGGLRGQLTEINEKLGEEINDFDTISYPGYSIDLMVSLNRNMSNHPAYIFDRGNSTEKERLSLYVNKYNELCYRLIDSSGEIYTITINENNAGISLGKLVFIACEYGEIGNHSFQRLVINGTEVGRINFTRNLNLTNRIKLVGSTYGADMNGKFCSSFLAAYSSMGHATSTVTVIKVVQDIINEYLTESKAPLMKIDCSSYLRVRQDRNFDRIKTNN